MKKDEKGKELVFSLLNPSSFLNSCQKKKIAITTYPTEISDQLSLNDTLLLSLLILSRNQGKKVVSYGDWYAQIFILFPKKYGISSDYPMLLDSEKINKRWRDLKTRGLILGSRVSGWKLTPPGKNKAEELLIHIGSPKGEKIALESILSIDISSLMKRFHKVKVFKEWDGNGTPEAATMNELSNIIGISVGGKRQEIGSKLLGLVDDKGVLDGEDPELMKARKWLLYQCMNLRRFMGEGSTFTKHIDMLSKKLNLIIQIQ